ncbi:MAG: phage portal protein [Pseudomonadota bacterium]
MPNARQLALQRVRRRFSSSTLPTGAERTGSVAEASTRGGSSFIGWTPSLTPADQENRSLGRDLAVARARDLVANEPLAAAAMDRKVDMVFGMRGLRFSSLPDGEALGLDPEETAALGDQIERAFNDWSQDTLWRCDWEQSENWGGLCALMARHYFRDNEAIAVLRWDELPAFEFPFHTSLHVVDPDRISNPDNRPDTPELRAGVETDGRRVVAYHIRNAHPNDWTFGSVADAMTWTRVPRQADYGRPIVLHLRRKDRADEVRGWGPLMATLKKFKDLSRYTDAEIQSAVVRAVMAMVIYSDRSTQGIEEALSVQDIKNFADASDAFYGPGGPKLTDGTRIQKLFPTEKVEMLTANSEGGDYEAFTSVFSRQLASALGMTYEQFTMDWSKTNYSSARAGLIEVWRSVESFVDLFTSKVGRPVLLAVIDDAVESGHIVVPDHVPDIYENPRAWLDGIWLGSGRGWVDPVKEPMGAGLEMEIGASTLQDVTARQGRDWRQVSQQRAREQREFDKLGINPPKPVAEVAALVASKSDEGGA